MHSPSPASSAAVHALLFFAGKLSHLAQPSMIFIGDLPLRRTNRWELEPRPQSLHELPALQHK
jgi:hypothetical protein